MAAAFVAQLAIWLIMVVAAVLFTSIFDDGPSAGCAAWAIVFCFLLTTLFLVFTEQLSSLWKPLFPGVSAAGLSLSAALLLTFAVDTLLVMFLVAVTGGSFSSPFTPVYFLLPVLAIFLREPAPKVIFYTVFVAAGFTSTFFLQGHMIGLGGEEGDRRRKVVYWFVSISTFALATWIGLITQPK